MFLQESWAKYGPDGLYGYVGFLRGKKEPLKGEIERLNLQYFAYAP